MDEQTRKLYEECNIGCQMAIESMQQIKDFTQDTTLFLSLIHILQCVSTPAMISGIPRVPVTTSFIRILDYY